MPLAFSNWWAPIRVRFFPLLPFILVLWACQEKPKEESDAFSHIPSPPHNPISKAGVELGKALFFEKGLSGNGEMNCATCHPPERAFTRPDLKTKRAIPTLYNLAWAPRLFWDGSQQNLESLIFNPIADQAEMGGHILISAQKLARKSQYKRLFRAGFGKDTIYPALISRALSQYIRSLVWPLPEDSSLSVDEKEGKILFQKHCEKCHSGPQTTDFEWKKSILAASGTDKGKFHLTKNPKDDYYFKTPGLARISATAPYMHNNSISNLDSLLVLYQNALELNDLNLPENRAKLLAYLKKL